MRPRLLSNLVGVAAIGCLVAGVAGLFGPFVALVALGVLLAAVGYLLAQQEGEEVDIELTEAVETALQKAQLRHELELAGAVSRAEERGRTEFRQQVAAEHRSSALATELERALS